MASQFNVAAEKRVIMEEDDDWITDNNDDESYSYSYPAISMEVDVVEGSETAQISHAGGEFYELVRDEIRKQHK